jgi:hypothetical protein
VIWDGRDAPAGVYFLRIDAGSGGSPADQASAKLLVIR